MKIVYAEDLEKLQDYVKNYFETHLQDSKVFVAESEKQALEIYDQHKDEIDLVITDGKLLYGCGWSLAKILKEDKNYKGPIIFAGGTVPPKDYEKFFDSYVIKGIFVNKIAKDIYNASKKYFK
jgi:DNA-binding response OmpR family regulator